MPDPVVFPERPRVAVACGATLGEGAIWDDRTGTLLFVDIKGHRVHRWRPGDRDTKSTDTGEDVGFVLLTDHPDIMLLGLKSGLARLDLRADGRPEPLLRPEPDRPGNRLNDGCAGPGGCVLFSSLDDAHREPTGRFYAWDGADLTAFGRETVVANGPTFDAGRNLVYATDTTNRCIYRHAVGPGGRPQAAEVFVTLPEGAGHPDGSAVDAEGHLWVCHWGGSRVTRFSPEGEAVLEVTVPTAQVTKVAFGGPDLGTLFITTAAEGRDREIDPMAGHVFAVETGIRGVPAGRVRLPA